MTTPPASWNVVPCPRVMTFSPGAVLALVAWLLLQGLFPNSVHAAVSPFVQKNDRQIVSGTANAVSFSRPTTAGNLIVVYVVWDNPGTVSVSDTQGNTYVGAAGPSLWNSGRYNSQVIYAKKIKGGADRVTARFATAIRSFTEPPGLKYSTFARTVALQSRVRRFRRTSGVSPMVSRMLA